MTAPAHWQRSGLDWPNRQSSAFIDAGGIHWHVQEMGQGPALLLLHGTGSATHTWGVLAPLLAEDFRVVAVDLPGHGFTDVVSGRQASLPSVASLLAALLDTLGIQPALVVGHSAGAAILARLCLDRTIAPAALVSLNGAFVPFGGAAAPIFSGAARMLAGSTMVPYMVAIQGYRRRSVQRLIEQTGSHLKRQDIDRYCSLVREPRHVTGTLRMMANWDLRGLWRQLPRLPVPLVLVVCENDLAVAPDQAKRLALRVGGSRLQRVPDLGHLGHEEDPEAFADIIRAVAAQSGMPAPGRS
jgi:magnesium chelatase accessory protein